MIYCQQGWVLQLVLPLKGFLIDFLFESFFWNGIHCMQDWTATMRHGVTRKRSTKRLEHTGNLFRKNIQLKDVC